MEQTKTNPLKLLNGIWISMCQVIIDILFMEMFNLMEELW